MELNHRNDAHTTAMQRVTDRNGQALPVLAVEYEDKVPQLRLQLPDGTQVLVPQSTLTPDSDGSYRLPFATSDISNHVDAAQLQQVIPVIEETLQVKKRVVDTGHGVRIHKQVTQREQVVDEPLYRDHLEVRHVPIEQIVDAQQAPAARQEGDTLIVPVLEEVLVIAKQLRLKEEIHITRRREQVRTPQTVVLQAEQVIVERFDDTHELSR